MRTRKASIKETGEEISAAEWERFDAAVAELKAERQRGADQTVRDERQQTRDRGDQALA